MDPTVRRENDETTRCHPISPQRCAGVSIHTSQHIVSIFFASLSSLSFLTQLIGKIPSEEKKKQFDSVIGLSNFSENHVGISVSSLRHSLFLSISLRQSILGGCILRIKAVQLRRLQIVFYLEKKMKCTSKRKEHPSVAR